MSNEKLNASPWRQQLSPQEKCSSHDASYGATKCVMVHALTNKNAEFWEGCHRPAVNSEKNENNIRQQVLQQQAISVTK